MQLKLCSSLFFLCFVALSSITTPATAEKLQTTNITFNGNFNSVEAKQWANEINQNFSKEIRDKMNEHAATYEISRDNKQITFHIVTEAPYTIVTLKNSAAFDVKFNGDGPDGSYSSGTMLTGQSKQNVKLYTGSQVRVHGYGAHGHKTGTVPAPDASKRTYQCTGHITNWKCRWG